MLKFTTHFWLDSQAEQAAEFYMSLFPGSQINQRSYYPKVGQEIHGHAAGELMAVDMTLAGQSIMLFNGGPLFTPNPSISLTVNCESQEEIERLWSLLVDEGTVLMDLQEYPFAPKYGWVADRFGVSWQLSWSQQPVKQKLVTSMLFVGKAAGQAMQAMKLYTEIFPGSSILSTSFYPEPEQRGEQPYLQYGAFELGGIIFSAMDSNIQHDFAFNESVSILVSCDTQEELDLYWSSLSADPESEQCGWLKDRFGVSWQIVPSLFDTMMGDSDSEGYERVMQAMFDMKKFDIATLQAAYDGV